MLPAPRQYDESWEPITSINITPLVDVSLVLVIIFMLTMPFLMDWALRVAPARAAAPAQRSSSRAILVRLDRGGVSVDGRRTTLEDISPVIRRLVRERGRSSVAFRASRDIPHGEIVRALDAVAEAGVADLNLLQPEEPVDGAR